jgi:hypothetical protein
MFLCLCNAIIHIQELKCEFENITQLEKYIFVDFTSK